MSTEESAVHAGEMKPALAPHFYRSQEMFDLEKARIFHAQWFCVGREAQLPLRGDYLHVAVAGESLVVVRGKDDLLRAFYNVCRHRGSRLVRVPAQPDAEGTPPVGHSGHMEGGIVCPYHAWTYNLDGSLRASPFVRFDERCPKSSFSLVPVRLDSWGGFIFVNLSETPAQTLSEQLGTVPARLARYPLKDMRRGGQIVYDVRANWKVLMENYNECYHCGPVHPELCALVPAFREQGGAGLTWDDGIPHRPGAWTFTMSGTSSRPPFPGLSAAEKVNHKGEVAYPNLLLSLAAEHVAAFTLWPMGPALTRIACDFLFHVSEVDKPGFDPSDVIDFWDVVNRQDWGICESVQDGMSSRGFRGAFYAPMEDPSLDIRRYLEKSLGDLGGARPEKLMSTAYDVIVIGGGHNGLTAAFYLARAGLKTLVLERREILGGCCVTEEIDPVAAPGCRVSTASYMASMLRPEIIRDLELAKYGLRMVAADPGVQAVTPDGRIIPWWSDTARMRQELQQLAPEDCERFLTLEDRLKGLARHLEPLFMRPPPDLQTGGLAGFAELLRFGFQMRGVRGTEIADLVSFTTGSLGEFLDRSLTSPHLKSLVLANSLYGKHGGPYDGGTLFGLLFHLLGGGSEAKQGFMGHVIGGMGAITGAMAQACKSQGVEMRTSSPVKQIGVHGGRATAVVLEDGSEITARVIVSNADPKRTFLGLVPPSQLDPQFLADIRGIKMDGPCAKFNLVLDEEPQLNGLGADAPALRKATYTLVPWLDSAQLCYERARQGLIHDDLWIDCLVPSAVDPTLTTAGKHVMTCFVQYLPYRLANSTWEAERDGLAKQILQHIARFVPAVGRSVVASRLYTPADLESVLGITEGNIFHGDIRLDQLFFMRPVPAYARYATPLRALYLCGAGTHPGGGVTGAPGFNAAHRVLADLKTL